MASEFQIADDPPPRNRSTTLREHELEVARRHAPHVSRKPLWHPIPPSTFAQLAAGRTRIISAELGIRPTRLLLPPRPEAPLCVNGVDAPPRYSLPRRWTPKGLSDIVNVKLVKANIARDLWSKSSGPDLLALVSADAAFAFDLYHALRREHENLFLSPFSIASALAMTCAGAHGQTAKEMAEVLHLPYEGDVLHAARNRLDLTISPPLDPEAQYRLRLRVANSLWVQAGLEFRQAFLDTLARNYGAGVRTVDFAHAPEAARTAVNEWIEEATEGKFRDLINEGAIDELTRMLLVNAVYFRARWEQMFHHHRTTDEPFYALDGSEGTAAMMHTLEDFGYAAGEGYQAIRLPYLEGTSMLVIVPEAGCFDEVDSRLTPSFLAQVRHELNLESVDLGFPRFQMTSQFSLAQVLGSLGMTSAFEPPAGSSGADFTGMTERRELFIHDLKHEAWIAVDEEGTEASAATVAISVGGPAEPTARLDVDRPFFFVVEDDLSQVLLFVGRLMRPSA